MLRKDGRSNKEPRKTNILHNIQEYAEGSVLIEVGATKIICAVSIENTVPLFLRSTGKGWITAEYSMLPRSTHTRTQRESSSRPKGRSGAPRTKGDGSTGLEPGGVLDCIIELNLRGL